MIFLLLAFLMSFFSFTPTFFVLLSFLVYAKKDFFSFLFIPLIIDLFLTHTYFLNTILFVAFFFLFKHLKITKTNFRNYLLSITLLYFLYIFSLGIIQGYHFFYLVKFAISNYGFQLVFYALSYKILLPYIKLSR